MKWTILMAVFVVGCATGSAARFEDHPPRPADHPIAVYATTDAPVGVLEMAKRGTPPGTLIGKVDILGGVLTAWSTSVEKAKSEARAMGGDAILVGHFDEIRAGLSVTVYRR